MSFFGKDHTGANIRVTRGRKRERKGRSSAHRKIGKFLTLIPTKLRAEAVPTRSIPPRGSERGSGASAVPGSSGGAGGSSISGAGSSSGFSGMQASVQGAGVLLRQQASRSGA